MHIGIHINNSFIAAATTDRNGNAILIKDESIESGKPYMNPLSIYIEDEFAYLGDKINPLIAHYGALDYATNFLDTLSAVETPAYKDGSGTHWNTTALIAVFLKKLKTDLRIYSDTPVKSAVVTVPDTPDPSLTEALTAAFRMAAIPLTVVLPMEKAAIEGYRIINTDNSTKTMLLCYLDYHTLTLSLNTIDTANTIQNTSRISEKKLGEHYLYKRFFLLIEKRYAQITGKKIKENQRNFSHITTLVEELIRQTIIDNKAYLQLLCAVDDEVIELILTRAQVNSIIQAYIQEIMLFIKEALLKNNTASEAIAIVLCAGDARFFPYLAQQLKTTFHEEHQELYHQAPEECLTKGAALYTATTANPTTPSSDTGRTTPKEQQDQKPPEIPNRDHKALLDIDHLSQLIKTININAGCETL
ncbi:MAG: Hsp70 family protein [Bacteroidota bacterium]